MKNFKTIISALFLLSTTSFSQIMIVESCGAIDTFHLGNLVGITFDTTTTTVTDIDDNVYKTLKIGNQWWMAENLKVTHYRNGDPIVNVTDNTDWINLSSGAYCVYNNDDNNIATYGLLYNGFAVSDSRNIAPDGWHVPTDAEWQELESYLGMSDSDTAGIYWRGTDEGGMLKSIGTFQQGDGLWYDPNTGATNASGFSAHPGGFRQYNNGWFVSQSIITYFWTNTDFSRGLGFNNSGIYRNITFNTSGFNVRLVKD